MAGGMMEARIFFHKPRMNKNGKIHKLFWK